jgi:hypothetical protein
MQIEAEASREKVNFGKHPPDSCNEIMEKNVRYDSPNKTVSSPKLA